MTSILLHLISPLDLIIIMMLCGFCLNWFGRRRSATILFLSATVVFAFTSIPFFANIAISWLERQHPALPASEYPACDAIVVLGGSVQSATFPRPEAEELGEARLLQAVRLYKAGKARLILASSGTRQGTRAEGISEAHDMKAILLICGIPSDAIVIEPESLNTVENAAKSAQILHEHGCQRILLVTSAMHLRRASTLFRHHGFDVVPVPNSFRVVESPRDINYYLPHAYYLWQSNLAIREYIGYLAIQIFGPEYKLRSSDGR